MFAELVEEWDRDLTGGDPLVFPGYSDVLERTDRESVRTGRADGFVLIEGDFDVVGGSMGLVHGEKVVRAFDRAVELRLPVVVVTRSGGARMQEGMLALVQLPRTAAALSRHGAAGLLSVGVLLSPTTGGVLASYGSLTDVRVAEAGATIGFAGPRVVEQTTGVVVGDRSHTAESALAAGLVDAVRPTGELRSWVDAALGRAATPLRVPRSPTGIAPQSTPVDDPAWAAVLSARAMGRPTGVHLAAAACTSWTGLADGGDRSVRVGLALVGAHRTLVVACDRYSGRPTAKAFRVARRGIELADRLGLPIVTLVDTPGADPGPDSENDGLAAEIARTFAALARVAVPVVSVCVGEGGSGGALALATADRLLVQETSVFSVIGPEGAAAILERDATKAPEVASRLGLTSADLLRLGIVDRVVPDSIDGTVAALHGELDQLTSTSHRVARLARWDAATAHWLGSGRSRSGPT